MQKSFETDATLPDKTADGSGISRRDLMVATGLGAAVATAGLAYVQPAAAEGADTTEGAVPPPSAAVAAKAVASLRDPILRISRETWENAELSMFEDVSHQIHLREIEAQGFTVTSRQTSGYPTAFIAEWTQGSGGPVIGFLPEYDALPGLGNAAEPRQTPGPKGVEVGHGCGHNVIGAGCTGAAFALKAMMQADGTPGTVRIYGCASEEAQGVKVYMVRDGYFDDCNAAIAFHPAPVAVTGAIKTAANDAIRVMFRGRTAHAGNTPWDGRSALKAAELFGHGINLMREHIRPTARLHYIYEAAGVAPNVVPDFAQVWLTIRDVNRPQVEAMTEWASQVAAGAAMATQTEAEFLNYYGMWDLLPNDTMIGLMHRHMTAHGLQWTDAEQAFAKGCQKEMGLPEVGLATDVLPVVGEITAGGSTDIGDISYVTPVGLFGWPSLPQGVSLHTWPVTACGGMSIGDKASLDCATIMAGAGYDAMTSPDLLAAAKADLVRRRGEIVYKPAIGKDQVPFGLPAFMVKAPGDDRIGATEAES
jgi:aminobenzoyl-glutamate utilization protein B